VLAVADAAVAVVDNDPANPLSDSERSVVADPDSARMQANLGLQSATAVRVRAPELADAAPTTIELDIVAAQDFLDACIAAHPRVGYGLGAKVPFPGAVPGKDFRRVDCSGFVREAIRRAEAKNLGFPDGSVVQHDWVRSHHFAADTVAGAGAHDGIVRIAFLRPQDSPSRIGHVVLIHDGRTLESHGGIGPDSRPWTGEDWQRYAFVYRLTAATA
jgi:hypothetical protein